ncbi:hypothetical protein GGR26_001163 [Lewinella marina]|uniref:Uncharacterized protein n=1 Tax=Neolewinella marina TaxID=438751 RepID=A0A2G0CG44_9BACT|nr:hypothetical protein [Neolewinella marina]NJB85418.1 hypothetical protein [Neolewinella marina]PHK98890.1 hypothetical protein CGL56_10540 [Neolewinella marina]
MNKLLLALLSCTLIFACEKEKFVVPNDLTDVKTIVGSRNQNDLGQYIAEVGDHLAFADLSQGAISHEWIIEGGNALLGNDFKAEDTTYSQYILPGQLSTQDPTAYVLFQTAGLQRVRLRNVFDRQVSFTATGTTAVREGNNWVVDTTYLVNVFGDLRPAFKVLKDGEEILSVSEDDEPDQANAANWTAVTLEVGQDLEFVDLTTAGAPTGRQWTLTGGAPATSSDSTATISYPSLGEHVGGTLRVIREGADVPAANAEKWIPIRVTVIPSSQPFVFTGELSERTDDVLSFRVSGEAKTFTGEEANFTVQVKNGEANFNQAIAVQKARVNAQDPTFIELVLAEPIYTSDTIKVSYGGGAIGSVDGRILNAFGPEPVVFAEGANVLTDDALRFEAGPDAYFFQQPQWSISTEQAASGAASAKFFVDDPSSSPGNMRIQTVPDAVPMVFPAGDYALSIKVYIPSGTDIVKMNTNLGKPFQAIVWDLTSVSERDEWVSLTQNMTLEANDNTQGSKFVIGIRRADITSSSATLFLDDISFVQRELRP